MWSDLEAGAGCEGAIPAGDGFWVTILLPLCPMMRAMTQKQGQRRALAKERRTVAVQPLGRER